MSPSSLGLQGQPLWILKLTGAGDNATWAVLVNQSTSFPRRVERWGLGSNRAACAHSGHSHPKGLFSTHGWAVPGPELPQSPHL